MTTPKKPRTKKHKIPPVLSAGDYDALGRRGIAASKTFNLKQALDGQKRIVTRTNQPIEAIYKLKEGANQPILVIRPNGETYLVNDKGRVNAEADHDDDLFHPSFKQLVHVHIRTERNSEGVHATGCKATYNCDKDSSWHGEQGVQCVAVEIEL